jgi:hypothetical protein
MNYETKQSQQYKDQWHVEAIGDEGEMFVSIFTGPKAEERAHEYANWKNGVRELAHAASR